MTLYTCPEKKSPQFFYLCNIKKFIFIIFGTNYPRPNFAKNIKELVPHISTSLRRTDVIMTS